MSDNETSYYKGIHVDHVSQPEEGFTSNIFSSGVGDLYVYCFMLSGVFEGRKLSPFLGVR